MQSTEQHTEDFDGRYRLGRKLVEELGTADGPEPTAFDLLGKQWDVVPGTYAPHPGTGTEWYTTAIPYPLGGRFLEIGCGAGVTAVWAALHGCAEVTATDIVQSAVDSTLLNAARHGVADRVRALRSDLFDELGPDERFDAVFWNCSVFEAPADFEFTRDFEWAIFDRGYSALGRYLSQVHGRLLPGGRALVTFNSFGDIDRITEVAAKAGTRLAPLGTADRKLAGEQVTYKLFEVLPA
ncbi:methyltransferase domain-containing protein [Streptomyces sp. NPDC049555]|uniref:methyltransferase domain-containing protein n=1 Tax=unclassified Streptomyces TaxID=2593676 RepID=UPI00344ABE8E